MKHGLAVISKGIVYLMGFAVLVVCGILLPELAREEAEGKSNPPSALPFLIGAWVLSVPIFIALHQTLKFFSYVTEQKVFSTQAVKALQNIKRCSIVFSVLIFLGAVTVIFIAKKADPSEDVAPVITIGTTFVFVSSVIATFIAVLQKLLEDAITMKSENDLTI